MGNWDLKLGFYNYLYNDKGLNVKNYLNTNSTDTETKKTETKQDISFNIFENEHYVHEYVSDVMGIDSTHKTIKMEDLLKMDVVDGQLVTEEEKKAKETEKETEKTKETKEAEKTNSTEETSKPEEDKSKKTEENKKEEKELSIKDLINQLLKQKEVVEILDTDKNGSLDKSEVEKFLKRLNIIDSRNEEIDKENLSMKEVFDGIIDIAQKEFQVQNATTTTPTTTETAAATETTAATDATQVPQATDATQTSSEPVSQTSDGGYVDNTGRASYTPADTGYIAPTGGNGGYSGSNGYCGEFDNQGNFHVKTNDITKMSKTELAQELQKAQATATEKKSKLTEVRNGTDAEIKALKDAVETAYNEYLKQVEKISKEKAEELNKLKTAVDDAQKAYDDKEIEIDKAEAAETEAKSNLDIAQDALNAAKEKLDSLSSVDTSDYSPEKLAEFNEKKSELQTLIKQKEQEKAEAQKAYDEAKTNKEKLIKERDEVLKQKLDETKKALSDFEQKLLEEHPELKEFQQKHEQAKQNYETKKASMIESLKGEVKSADEKVLKIKAEIAKQDTAEKLGGFTSSVNYSEDLIKSLQTNHKINVGYDKNGNMYLHYNWARYNEGKIQPELAEALLKLEQYAQSKGYVIVRSDGERTMAESNAGRAKKGGIVCKGGNSPHNYGAAADLTVFKANGQQVTLWDTPDLVKYAKSIGLDWGGDFGNGRGKYEGHHVQLKNWKSRFKNSANLVG